MSPVERTEAFGNDGLLEAWEYLLRSKLRKDAEAITSNPPEIAGTERTLLESTAATDCYPTPIFLVPDQFAL